MIAKNVLQSIRLLADGQFVCLLKLNLNTDSDGCIH